MNRRVAMCTALLFAGAAQQAAADVFNSCRVRFSEALGTETLIARMSWNQFDVRNWPFGRHATVGHSEFGDIDSEEQQFVLGERDRTENIHYLIFFRTGEYTLQSVAEIWRLEFVEVRDPITGNTTTVPTQEFSPNSPETCRITRHLSVAGG